MDYKNKYEQALERARIWKDKSGMPKDKQGILDDIFPELKESEDEKIRKEIIDYIKTGTYKKDWIAWLEKQAEHANFRNKIQIGDKVTRNKDGILVNLSQLNRVAKPADKVEPKFHKGDIIKPKDGGHEPWQIIQVDIFDKKYRFKDGYVVHFSQEDAYELVEQKPTDEEMKELLRTECENGRADAIAEMQRSWSEEDEKKLLCICAWIKDYPRIADFKDEMYTVANNYINWLKSLKDRVQPQQEKERILGKLEEWLDEYISNLADVGTDTLIGSFRKYLDGKLPVKPKSQWNPSDEQMDALNDVISSRDIKYDILSELWKDLKKLREV